MCVCGGLDNENKNIEVMNYLDTNIEIYFIFGMMPYLCNKDICKQFLYIKSLENEPFYSLKKQIIDFKNQFSLAKSLQNF